MLYRHPPRLRLRTTPTWTASPTQSSNWRAPPLRCTRWQLRVGSRSRRTMTSARTRLGIRRCWRRRWPHGRVARWAERRSWRRTARWSDSTPDGLPCESRIPICYTTVGKSYGRLTLHTPTGSIEAVYIYLLIYLLHTPLGTGSLLPLVRSSSYAQVPSDPRPTLLVSWRLESPSNVPQAQAQRLGSNLARVGSQPRTCCVSR